MNDSFQASQWIWPTGRSGCRSTNILRIRTNIRLAAFGAPAQARRALAASLCDRRGGCALATSQSLCTQILQMRCSLNESANEWPVSNRISMDSAGRSSLAQTTQLAVHNAGRLANVGPPHLARHQRGRRCCTPFASRKKWPDSQPPWPCSEAVTLVRNDDLIRRDYRSAWSRLQRSHPFDTARNDAHLRRHQYLP